MHTNADNSLPSKKVKVFFDSGHWLGVEEESKTEGAETGKMRAKS
jgi:hypothetical protein